MPGQLLNKKNGNTFLAFPQATALLLMVFPTPGGPINKHLLEALYQNLYTFVDFLENL